MKIDKPCLKNTHHFLWRFSEMRDKGIGIFAGTLAEKISLFRRDILGEIFNLEFLRSVRIGKYLVEKIFTQTISILIRRCRFCLPFSFVYVNL